MSIRTHKLIVEKFIIKQKILELHQLLEAQNYEGMFASLLQQLRATELSDDGDIDLTDHSAPMPSKQAETLINQFIKWAKDKLKKNDRIVWFLRWARYWLWIYVLNMSKEDAIKQFNKMVNTHYTPNDYMPIHLMQRNLEHFMSIDAPDIQNYVFAKQTPRELFNTLDKMEKDWASSGDDDAGAQEMFENNRLIKQQTNDDIIMKFPDGFVWMDLHVPASDAEGKAMGHCGNRASFSLGETILSLRKPIKYRHEKYWYPVCTFILDKDGQLGEMKGRANEKPQARYHPYIIALLKTPRIKNIKGGGYAPENNFSLSDLTPEQKNSLIETKPELMDMVDYYKLHGINDELRNKIENWCHANDLDFADVEDSNVIIERYKNITELVKHIGNDTAKYVMSILNGDEFLEPHIGSYHVKDLLKSLKEEDLEYVGKYLQQTYPDDVDNDYDPKNVNDVISLYKYTDDDKIKNIAYSAAEDGTRSGIESDMHDAMADALTTSPYIVITKSDDQWHWDSPCELVVGIEAIMNLIRYEDGDQEDVANDIYRNGWKETFEIELEIEQPYYGWDGYDENVAKERFVELIYEEL